MPVTIRIDARRAIGALNDAARRQIPIATAMAVNDVAFQVMRVENEALGKLFKRPGRWTTTATQVASKARKGSPVAVVSIRKGREYLTPYETGGVHVLPATRSLTGGTLFNPKAVALNASGQLKPGTIAALLARPDVFKGTVHGVRGIWQRLPRGRALSPYLRARGYVRQYVRLLIRFGDALPVKQQLHFRDRAALVVAKSLPGAFERAFAQAMRTAR